MWGVQLPMLHLYLYVHLVKTDADFAVISVSESVNSSLMICISMSWGKGCLSSYWEDSTGWSSLLMGEGEQGEGS